MTVSQLESLKLLGSLLSAVEKGNHAEMTQLIAAGALINGRVDIGNGRAPPLDVALRQLDVEACRILLEAGAAVEWEVSGPRGGKRRQCALRKFLNFADLPEQKVKAICQLLLQAGANPNGIDAKSNFSPLYLAFTSNYAVAIDLLMQAGADTNKPEKGGLPLEKMFGDACAEKNDKRRHEQARFIVQMLRHGADDACATKDGLRLFAAAVKYGLDAVVGYCITERGEDVAQRVKGRTLLQLAKQESTRQLLRSFKTASAIEVAIGGDIALSKPGVGSQGKKGMGML